MNIGIVGLGLIGGSIGLDLRSRGFDVFGVSSREQTCQRAVALGVVDAASVNLSDMAVADVVFICTPLGSIESIAQKLVPHLSPDTILTDVGSVKTPIVQPVSSLWPNFVGGHPMAGTAESGIEAAVRDLFVGRPYVVTPTAETPMAAVERVEEIARSLGAKVYRCGPEEHDRAVAGISHLPIMASATLVAACAQEGDRDIVKLAQHLASSGFRDTSRVGGGNPELGVMVARYNRVELLRSLSIYRDCLDEFISDIEAEDWQALEQKLKLTQEARRSYDLSN
ncbi:MAG: prephenate/arogenate dehydrogenase [Tychonema bourrellyi B0820]|uniref:Arogenate dehydrogenase n=1 Tax=Tychonema bourrellyi FEM_GT703 TaxID=2040638 RepID=A0A2G4EWI0_9CYAN|nr:prephenate/arogenate dehydrogenase [Tychonema bourrellyi]MDQ2096258.1 prephenate/arogenate dehydrogenase [Tychonema bourrellyi B0820]PHX53893.1 arogenate dehydrogenase [Tychonema bourrellyi FEM_GT703]